MKNFLVNRAVGTAKKNFSLGWLLVPILLIVLGLGNAWGANIVIDLDLTTAATYPVGFPTTTGTSSGTYTLGGYSFTISAPSDIYKHSSGYLFLTGINNTNESTAACITFPAIANYKLTEIVVTPTSGGSTAVNLSVRSNYSTVVSGGTAWVYEQGSSNAKTWTLTGTSANTSYKLYVEKESGKGSKNCQIAGLKLTYEPTASSYTLVFKDTSGSTNGSSTTISANATTFSFGATAPSKTGHHLIGFYKGTDLTTNQIADTLKTGAVVTGGKFLASTDYTNSSRQYTETTGHDLYLKWEADSYNVTATLTNTSASSAFPSSVTYTGSTTTALNRTLTASSGYALPTDITVTMGGSTLTKGTHYSWNSSTGAFTFDVAVTGAIVITVTSSVVYTVSFSTGTGNPSQDAITEASGGAGITLPNVTPSCSGDGWLLYGWKTTAALADETTTAPTIVGKPGDTYKPSGNITLYAVYAKGEYTKEISSITAGGKYIIAAYSSGHNYVMTNDYQKPGDYGQLKGKLIDETTTNKYHAANVHANYVFTIVTSASVDVASGDWMIKNIVDNKYVSPDFKNFYVSSIGNADGNTITWNSENSGWDIVNVYGSTNMLQYDAGNNLFISASPATSLLIYKETTTPKYNSAPECCTPLGEPATLTLDKTAYTITAEWTATSGGNETGYSVQLYDNSGGEKGDAIGDPISRTSSQLSYTFGAKTPVGDRLTANHKYYIGVTPKYSGSDDFCATGTEKLVSVTTDHEYTVTYNNGGGSGTMTDENSPYEAGDEVTVKANTFTKSGYTFIAWSYSPAVSVTDGKFEMPSSNVVITATWTAKKNYYVDRMHGNCDGVNTVTIGGVVYNCYLREGAGYTRPDLSDNDGGTNDCVTGHEHFIGWVAATNVAADGSYSSGTIYAGGSSGTATNDGTIYYAVWGEE